MRKHVPARNERKCQRKGQVAQKATGEFDDGGVEQVEARLFEPALKLRVQGHGHEERQLHEQQRKEQHSAEQALVQDPSAATRVASGCGQDMV